MMTCTKSLLVLAVLAVAHCSSGLVTEQVVNKLENHALGVSRGTTGIQLTELLQMVDEWQALPAAAQEVALKQPQYKLAYHFVVLPTERLRNVIAANPAVYAAHLQRIERGYKRFRDAYMGNSIEAYDTGNMRMPKLQKLILAVQSENDPITIKDFLLAKSEHDAWLTRLNEIVMYEDVYANQDEMRNILNYMNSEMTKPLFEHVFPVTTPSSDPQQLKKLYLDKFFEITGIRFINGQPTQVA